MNLPKILIAVVSVFMSTLANADCYFGNTTWELEEKFEAPRERHEFYKGETLSLSKEVRLGGLHAYERQLISLAMRGGDVTSPADLKEFSRTDGYLTYFSHAPSGRQFVQVGHYPGDNEYGAIVEITVSPAGANILGVVAEIADGEISECRIRADR